MRKLILAILALSVTVGAGAQQRDTTLYPDSFLDTVQVSRQFKLNDYTMVGVEYGVSWNDISFNPVYNTTRQWNPGYTAVWLTRYGKMFGYMPYFGIKIGLAYGTEAFRFKTDKDTGITRQIYGDNGRTGEIGERMHVVEVPMLAHMHIDARNFKVMADAGIYGGYRLDIERFGDGDEIPTDQNTFRDFEKRLDYGLQGGLGFGIVFNPIEIHFNARLRYSWGTLYEPNWHSEYYYRYAYPLDVMFTAGIHYQLTKRSGKTRKVLKKEAYDIVYGTDEDK